MVDIVTLYEDPWVNPTGSQDVPHHLNPYIYGGIGAANYKPLYGARLCTLTSALSCVVTEEINGIYTLDMEYPIDGVGADYIKIGRVISAKNNPFNSSQLFRIIKITRTLRKTFKVSAEHLSYDLDDYTIQPFSVGQFDTHLADMLSYAQGLDWGEDGSHYPYGYILGYQRYIDSEQGPEYIKQNFPFRFVIDGYYHTPGDGMPDPSYAVSAYPAPIDYWSTKKTMYSEKVSTVREFIGGANTGLLATFGGELWYNISDDGHADVIFTKQRGTNRGFVIKYGKNLMSMTYDVRGGKRHSAWYPYYRYCSNADNHEYLFWDIEDDLMNALDILHDLPVPPFEGQIKRPSPDSPYLVYDHYEDAMTYVNIFPVDITQYADLTLKASGYTWEELVETSDTLSAAEKRRRRVLRSYIIVGGLQSYFEASGASYAPTSSEVTCDFETLYGPGSGNEYKKALEELRLGDTVTLLYDEAGHSEQMRIRKMEYDSVTGRYKKLTLGSIKDKKQSAAASIASSSLHSEGEQEKQYSNAASFTTDVKKIIGQVFDNDVFATTPLGKEYHIDPNTGDPILTINASGIGTIVHGAVDPLYLDAQNHVNLRYSSIDFLLDRTDNNALKLKNPLPAAVTGEDEDKYLYVDDNGYISWDDLRLATSSVVGGIKTGYTTSGTNFAVQLDQNGKAFVTAMYSAQNPIYLDGTTFKLRYGSDFVLTSGTTLALQHPLPYDGSDGQVLMWSDGPDWTTLTTSDISNIESWISGKSYATTTYVNEIASGLSAAYSVRVGQNPSFNSQSDHITITGPITTTTGASIPLSSLKVGDVVYVVDTDIPDRWVSSVTSSSATLYTLETVKPAIIDVQINSNSIVSNRIANIALSSSFSFNTTNNTLSLQKAGSSTLGGIKTGYTTSGTNYKVQVDSNGNAYVTVPKANIEDGTADGQILVWNVADDMWRADTKDAYSLTHPNNTNNIVLNKNGNAQDTITLGSNAWNSTAIPAPYTSTPANVGTASAGSSSNYARGDHVHDITVTSGPANGQVTVGGHTVSVAGLKALAYLDAPDDLSSGAVRYLVYEEPDGYRWDALTWADIGSKPTTIARYGITDAKIQNGVITLGSNTITPVTSIQFGSGTAKTGNAITVAKADITALGIPGSDTNTTYTLNVSGTGANAGKVGLVAGGSGSGTTWYTIPYATAAGEATKDSDSNTIADYYGHALTVSGNTIGLKNAQDDDITGSFITVPYATAAGSANSVAWANVSGHANGVKADLAINDTSGSTSKYLSEKGNWVFLPSDVNTWRDIGVNGDPWKGTGTGTGPIDFTNDTGISITTGTGQNANKLYIGVDTTKIPLISSLGDLAWLDTITNAKITGGTSGYLLKSNGTSAASWVSPDTLNVSHATTAESIYDPEGQVTYTIEHSVPSDAVFTDTTYTFANGTNGFTVTPAGGTAQTVTVTPSISDNITGTGTRTSGYLAKFSGTNTITNAAQYDTGATNGTIAQRTSNGYLFATYFNTTVGQFNPSSYTSSSVAFIDQDGWLRKSSKADFASWLGDKFQLVRVANATYNPNAGLYQGGTYGRYIRIKLPYSTIWFMMHMEVSIRGNYQVAEGGKLIIKAHHTSTAPYNWQQLNAYVSGKLTNIKVYSSDGQYIYIDYNYPYRTVSVDKLLTGDTAALNDCSNIVVDSVSELPETYQTATLQYSLYSTRLLTSAQDTSYDQNSNIMFANSNGIPNVVSQSKMISSFTVPGSVIAPNGTELYSTPIPHDLWHDILAFNNSVVPKYYTTADGTTWTEGTLENYLFAHSETWGAAVVLSDSIVGSRWVWLNGGYYASMARWLVLGIAYNNPTCRFDISVEASSDGNTWTSIGSQENLYYIQQPVWIKIPGATQNNIRITISRNSASAAGSLLRLCAIRYLTKRWGDQGKGSDVEYPYKWDRSFSILPRRNEGSNLGDSSYRWYRAYIGQLNQNASAVNINSYSPRGVAFIDQNGWLQSSSKANFLTWLGISDARLLPSYSSSDRGKFLVVSEGEDAPAWETLYWSDISSTPTTLDEYGITDAKIQNGTITLGSNSITPVTGSSLTANEFIVGNGNSAIKTATVATIQTKLGLKDLAYIALPTAASDEGKFLKNEGMGAYSWAFPDWNNPMTKPNDIIVGGTNGAATRLEKGSNGTFLGINSSGNVAWLSTTDTLADYISTWYSGQSTGFVKYAYNSAPDLYVESNVGYDDLSHTWNAWPNRSAAMLTIYNRTAQQSNDWLTGWNFHAPNMAENTNMGYANFAAINLGKNGEARNSGSIVFHYAGNNALGNCITFGLSYNDHILQMRAGVSSDNLRTVHVRGNIYAQADSTSNGIGNLVATQDWVKDWVNPTCLIKGTKILMADGTEKNIEDVKRGDEVRSIDINSGKLITSMIVSCEKTGVNHEYTTHLFDNGSYIVTYGLHSVYNKTLGHPIDISKFRIGDETYDAEGTVITYAGNMRYYDRSTDVAHYDINTSNNLYFANGILNGKNVFAKYRYMRREEMDIPDSILAVLNRQETANKPAIGYETDSNYFRAIAAKLKEKSTIAKRIEEAKQKLADSDYLVAKFTEGLINAVDWLKAKAERSSWRTAINNDEPLLEAADNAIKAIKAKYQTDDSSVKDRFELFSAWDNAALEYYREWLVEKEPDNEPKPIENTEPREGYWANGLNN